jgi:hypothetical protein
MKSLEILKQEKETWEGIVKAKKVEFQLAKKLLKHAERDIKSFKKAKNKAYKDLRYGKSKVEQLVRKIKTTPSRVRQWSKANPGKVWNNIEDGKYD